MRPPHAATSTTEGVNHLHAFIQGRRLALRRLLPTDLPQLRAWDQDEEIARFSGQKFEGREADAWLLHYRHGRAQAMAIVELPNRLIGDLELEEINWRRGDAELRISLGDKSMWNMGYGTEAVQLVVRHAFESLGLKRLYLRVYRSNERAIRCYEKSGFFKEGLLRAGGRPAPAEDIFLMTITAERYRLARQGAAAGF